MFSLQTMFGKGDKFYGLLEASARAAHQSSQALVTMLRARGKDLSLEDFKLARQQEKEITRKIGEELVNTFVTALEREDIEALANSLYKIPKTVEKFAERYALLAPMLTEDVDFASRAVMLEKACEVIVQMVTQLRTNMRMDAMKPLNDRLQQIESEADRMILDLYKGLFVDADMRQYFARKDLFEILEKAIDRCRDVGNTVYQIVLKNT